MQWATYVTGASVQRAWLWEPATRAFVLVGIDAFGAILSWPFTSQNEGQKRNAPGGYFRGASTLLPCDGTREE